MHTQLIIYMLPQRLIRRAGEQGGDGRKPHKDAGSAGPTEGSFAWVPWATLSTSKASQTSEVRPRDWALLLPHHRLRAAPE